MMRLMTEKLFITRKRKKWKFHHFNQWPNCWQADEIMPKVISDFVTNKKLTIEIGAGTADLSLELARRYPDECFIACDLKSDRLYTGAKQALAEKVDNIRFLRVFIEKINDTFPKNCADTIWITFPDPYPRKGAAKHRLTHPNFLKMYERMLNPGGHINFKTDNQKLFEWSVEQFKKNKWEKLDYTRDLQGSTLGDDNKITTTFERRFMEQGLPIYFAKFSKS